MTHNDLFILHLTF